MNDSSPTPAYAGWTPPGFVLDKAGAREMPGSAPYYYGPSFVGPGGAVCWVGWDSEQGYEVSGELQSGDWYSHEFRFHLGPTLDPDSIRQVGREINAAFDNLAHGLDRIQRGEATGRPPHEVGRD